MLLHNNWIPTFTGSDEENWIPACAGMTNTAGIQKEIQYAR